MGLGGKGRSLIYATLFFIFLSPLSMNILVICMIRLL